MRFLDKFLRKERLAQSKAYNPKPGKPLYRIEKESRTDIGPKYPCQGPIQRPKSDTPLSDSVWGVPDAEGTTPEVLPNVRKVSEKFDSDKELFVKYFNLYTDDEPAPRPESLAKVDPYRTALEPPRSED